MNDKQLHYKSVIERNVVEARNYLADKSDIVFGRDYITAGVFLHGSQNYGVDDENSDVDCKVVVVPTYRGLSVGKDFSTTVRLPNGEEVVFKPLIEHIKLLFQPNYNNLEILTTEYAYDLNPIFGTMREFGAVDTIVKNMLKSFVIKNNAVLIQKNRNLKYRTERTTADINKYGYSRKEACHIFRVGSLISDVVESGIPFSTAIKFADNRERLACFNLIRQGQMSESFVNGMVGDMFKIANRLLGSKGISDTEMFKEDVYQVYLTSIFNNKGDLQNV